MTVILDLTIHGAGLNLVQRLLIAWLFLTNIDQQSLDEEVLRSNNLFLNDPTVRWGRSRGLRDVPEEQPTTSLKYT